MNTPTIRRLTPSRRHQLPRIAHHDVINTISTIVIAAFAVVLARVAWKQTRDARILQRAYLNVKFGGIQSNSAGEL
ncbi:MAG: hypothetical protein WAK67_21130, partial [Xanthobacteraceae bacterium]